MDRRDDAATAQETRLLKALRRAFHLEDMSIEEAQVLYENAEAVELSADQVNELVTNAISPAPPSHDQEPVSAEQTEEVHEQVLVLNRNKKKDRPGVRDFVERQKAEALDALRKRQEQAGLSGGETSGESGSTDGSGDS